MTLSTKPDKMTISTKPNDPDVQRAAVLFQLGIVMREVSGDDAFSEKLVDLILGTLKGEKKGKAWCLAALEHVDNIEQISFKQNDTSPNWVTIIEWKDREAEAQP